ncbi:penicillin-binding protein 2 [soil metagenome]
MLFGRLFRRNHRRYRRSSDLYGAPRRGRSETESDLIRFRRRLALTGVAFMVGFGLLTARFVWLQVVRHDDYQAQAEDNRITVVPLPPNRGIIRDRNGVVMARNYSAYTLEISPDKIDRDLDTLIDDLSKIVEIEPHHRRRFRKLLEDSRSFESLPIRTRLSDSEVAKFAAQRYAFPGVDIKARLFREYPLGESAGNVIGYIGRIATKDAERIATLDNASDYNGTNYIGRVGVEQSYERDLHGKAGLEEIEVTAGGRAVKTLSQRPATSGNNLVLSIDSKLQNLVEQLYGDRKGALVALDPRSGEVLAFVSKPTFDPNLFVEGIDPLNWDTLNSNPDKPMLNRPLRGLYPPGSTVKPFMALAALETGKRTPGYTISDPGYYSFGGRQFRDSKKGGWGTVDLHKSIVVSSDTYYYQLANDLGIDTISNFFKPFGFGELTGIDIDGEKQGIRPSTEWKRNAFKRPEAKVWFPGETISVGIGQGYSSYTILQLAHALSIIANNGVSIKPHLVKEVEDSVTGARRLAVPDPGVKLAIKQSNIDFVRDAMIGVTQTGTGAVPFKGVQYLVAAKTGTAQVRGMKEGEKYSEANTPEKYRDHSLFEAFAPADKPTIVIALIVENGGFGARSAGPIARAVLDYWVLGKLPDNLAAPPANVSSDDPPIVDGSEQERGLIEPARPDALPPDPAPEPAP